MIGSGNYFEIIFYLLIAFLSATGVVHVLSSVCDFFKTKGYNGILENLKKYTIPIVIVLLLLVSVIAPIVALYSGLFDEGRALHGSDVLGYYGALIGGVGTVLGVYWTLNYESKKSKEERDSEKEKLAEERKKDSLPLLRFTFKPDFRKVSLDNIAVILKNYDTNIDFDIDINTTREDSIEEYEKISKSPSKSHAKSSSKSHSKKQKDATAKLIYEYGDLEIENVGLGIAILSSVSLERTLKLASVKNLKCKYTKNYVIVPGKKITLKTRIICDDIEGGDSLKIYFYDPYNNDYSYSIHFKNVYKQHTNTKTDINPSDVTVLPVAVIN